MGVAVAAFDSLQKITTTVDGHTAVDATPLEPQTDSNVESRSPLKVKIRRPVASSRPTGAEVITRTTYHGAAKANHLLNLLCRLLECTWKMYLRHWYQVLCEPYSQLT